jgi:hypothetical protein
MTTAVPGHVESIVIAGLDPAIHPFRKKNVAKRLIGCDQQRATLVAHAGLGLVLADVGDVVEDQRVILVELCERAFEGELTPRHLKLLYEITGAGEQHAPAVLAKPMMWRPGKALIPLFGCGESDA